MKKKFILIPLCGLFLYVLLLGNAAGPGGSSSLECTGASGGPIGCGGTTCHGSVATPSTSLSVQLLSGSTVVTQYVGGGSYTLRISGINTIPISLPKFGFQISAVKTSTTTNAGVMSAVAGAHLITVAGINLLEHNPSPMPPTTGTGGGGSTYVVDIPWTAPAAGTGSITLYGVMNLVNNNGLADAGDKWKDASQVITELSATLGPITGTTTVCVTGTTTLSNALIGGTWSSSAPFFATIGASSGIVSGMIPGTSTITYHAGSAGIVTTIVTVNPIPTSIMGSTTACEGASITLSTTSTGGGWSSSNVAVATVGASTGVVLGISGGTSTISYSFTTGCKTTRQITINPLPSSGTIAGSSTVCVSTTTTLTNTVTGGTWSSSDVAKATVNSSTGVVTGISLGTATISYTATNSCGTGTVTKTVTVQPLSACTTGTHNDPRQSSADLNIYPNPNHGAFVLSVLSDNSEQVLVVITNVLGMTVKEFFVSTNSRVDVTLNNADGIYFIHATTTNGMLMKKVLIQ